MRLDDHFYNRDAQQNLGQFLRADPSPTLPTGAPNPNVGRAYLETHMQRNYRDTHTDAVRASGSYKFDLGRYFGSHTLAGVTEYDFEKTTAVQLREFVTSPNAPTITNPENNNNRVWRRTYVDLNGPSGNVVFEDWHIAGPDGLTDPVGGRTYRTNWIPFSNGTQFIAAETRTYIGMLQSNFWNKRINTVVGMSRDDRTGFASTQERTPLAGFTSGILTPVRDKVGNRSSARNITFSGVFHATQWLGLNFSKAENSGLAQTSGSIPSPDGTLSNQRPPRPLGRSQDIGIKLDLFDRRLFLNALYFETTAGNDFDFNSAVSQGSVNAIWEALAAHGVNDPITNVPIIPPRDSITGGTFASRTQGYEVDLTANPTKNWRLFLNYSRTKTARTNIAPEMVNYIAQMRGFWTQGTRSRLYLVGRGIGLAPQERDGNNTADTIAEQLDVIDASILNGITLANGRRPRGQIPQKLNFRTSYDFTEGVLRGFGVGGAVRWTDAPVVRFTAATATTPSTVNYGASQLFADLNVGYRRKFSLLGRNVNWSVQLNVDNVLNNDRFVVVSQSTTGEVLNFQRPAPVGAHQSVHVLIVAAFLRRACQLPQFQSARDAASPRRRRHRDRGPGAVVQPGCHTRGNVGSDHYHLPRIVAEIRRSLRLGRPRNVAPYADPWSHRRLSSAEDDSAEPGVPRHLRAHASSPRTKGATAGNADLRLAASAGTTVARCGHLWFSRTNRRAHEAT